MDQPLTVIADFGLDSFIKLRCISLTFPPPSPIFSTGAKATSLSSSRDALIFDRQGGKGLQPGKTELQDDAPSGEPSLALSSSEGCHTLTYSTSYPEGGSLCGLPGFNQAAFARWAPVPGRKALGNGFRRSRLAHREEPGFQPAALTSRIDIVITQNTRGGGHELRAAQVDMLAPE
jgi:hypothetical protein